jgi:hypothetical protein
MKYQKQFDSIFFVDPRLFAAKTCGHDSDNTTCCAREVVRLARRRAAMDDQDFNHACMIALEACLEVCRTSMANRVDCSPTLACALNSCEFSEQAIEFAFLELVLRDRSMILQNPRRFGEDVGFRLWGNAVKSIYCNEQEELDFER